MRGSGSGIVIPRRVLALVAILPGAVSWTTNDIDRRSRIDRMRPNQSSARTRISSSATSSTDDTDSSPDSHQRRKSTWTDPNDQVYLRWKKDGSCWKMQTAVTTFQLGNTILDLHAQVHFADSDYFEYYNSAAFTNDLDHVHYELLVDEDLLEYETATSRWRLKSPIMASPNDQSLAKSYGWTCQASQIDYTHSKWIHADMTRQEFLKLVRTDDASYSKSQQQQQNQQPQRHQGPLWKQASSNPQSSSAAAEAVSALLIGPPQLSYAKSIVKRRLFTNLFLPGSQLANALRAMLWMTVPAPELSIILLDWSSVLSGNGPSTSPSRSRRRSNAAVVTDQVNPSPSGLSDVAWPIFSSLAKLDVASMRRFLFGQVLVSSNNQIRPQYSQDQAWYLLVTQRNNHALKILNNTLNNSNNNNKKKDDEVHSALLYGSSHCPDLHTKLVADGFTPIQTEWRTAWSVQEIAPSSDNIMTLVPTLTILLLGYLAVGALDWVGMMGEVSKLWLVDTDHESYFVDAGLAAFLYLARHVLLYLGFSKFLVDWTNRNE